MAMAAKSYVAMLLIGSITLTEYQASVSAVKLGAMTRLQESAMAAVELGLDLDAEESSRIQAQLLSDEAQEMGVEEFLSFDPQPKGKKPIAIDLAAIKQKVKMTSSKKKKHAHKEHGPKDSTKVMTETNAESKQKDSELMAAAIQLVTS